MLVCNARHGRFIVNENDVYLARSLIELGEFAEEQVRLFRSIITRNMVVVDAGANIGAHTVALARMAGFVHAFEPQRQVYYTLCGNVALNHLHNVRCHHAALGDTDERIKIQMLDDGTPNNLGAFSIGAGGPLLDEVDVKRLDIRCNFLKIDVEGYELEVLRGAEPMIKECRPVIYVENDRPDTADELIDTVRALGYRPYWHVTPLYRKDNLNGAPDPFGGVSSVDMLCAPPGLDIEGAEEAMPGDHARKFGRKDNWPAIAA